jgi:hypothetical protein
MTLDEARDHVGEKVIYSTHPGQAEEGVISSVGRKYVHVRYMRSPDPVATYPENLVLMRGGSPGEHIYLNMTEAGFPVHMRRDW